MRPPQVPSAGTFYPTHPSRTSTEYEATKLRAQNDQPRVGQPFVVCKLRSLPPLQTLYRVRVTLSTSQAELSFSSSLPVPLSRPLSRKMAAYEPRLSSQPMRHYEAQSPSVPLYCSHPDLRNPSFLHRPPTHSLIPSTPTGGGRERL